MGFKLLISLNKKKLIKLNFVIVKNAKHLLTDCAVNGLIYSDCSSPFGPYEELKSEHFSALIKQSANKSLGSHETQRL